MYDFKHLKDKKLIAALKLRSDILYKIRNYFNNNNFIEIHTPILAFPTKEYGEGEYIAFSKLNPSKFYSLPHSPQIYKQYLIGATNKKINKYYQIAYNFRPEIGDEVHAQQFTQIDFEMADIELRAIIQTIHDIVNISFKQINVIPKYKIINYSDALKKYGSDSPDLRYTKSEINYKDGKAFIKIFKNDILDKIKFNKCINKLNKVEVDNSKKYYQLTTDVNCIEVLGVFRNKIINDKIVRLENDWSFVWLKGLPLFIKKDNGSMSTFHHPQMSPEKKLKKADLKNMSEKQLLSLKGNGCDLIINGLEIAGGNIRNNDYTIQRSILDLIGCSNSECNETYLPLMTLLKDAKNYKSGGAAIGLDRIIMLLTKNDSLNAVQAFPMDYSGKSYFGGPFNLRGGEIVDTGIEDENIIIKESRIAAINMIKKDNNIHNKKHSINVEKNVIDIAKGEKLLPGDIFLLRIASHWHDIGRNDQVNAEKIPHEEASIALFKKWANSVNLSNNIIDQISLIIKGHRNRMGNNKLKNILIDCLWDADKLDIININRCYDIISTYKNKKFVNEFNYLDTLLFWTDIKNNLLQKMRTKTGKSLYRQRHDNFNNFVNREFNKKLINSKKIIGLGGADTLTGKYNEIDIIISKLISKREKKLCYVPIGIFNNKQLMKGFNKYIMNLKTYYNAIDKGIKFTYISKSDSITEMNKRINNSDIIYLSGGNTQYLIKELKKYKLDKLLLKKYENGTPIVGNSAGLLVLSTDIYSYGDNNTLKHYKGLGIINNYIFIVHYKNKYSKDIKAIIKKHSDKEIIKLKEDNAIFLINGIINKTY